PPGYRSAGHRFVFLFRNRKPAHCRDTEFRRESSAVGARFRLPDGFQCLGLGFGISFCFSPLRRFHARSDRYLERDFLSQFHFFGRFSDDPQRGFHALAARVELAAPGRAFAARSSRGALYGVEGAARTLTAWVFTGALASEAVARG